MSSHSFITTFFKKGFLLAVACVAIFGVIGGYVHAQSTLPTDLITIDWTGANTQGFQVPQKLQTGHRFITPDTNFLHTQQQANGTVFTAEVFENYIAVSPAIYYADAALAQNYVLEFHLEDMQGELWHRIHEVPIAAAFDVNGDNVIQFRSSIQPLDAIVIDERGVRADNSLNPAAILPQNTPLVVRVYIRGNNVPRTLFNSYTLGSYAFRQSPGEALSSSWSFISQQAFASAVPGPLPFSTGQGTLSTTSSGFTQITETESSSFPETESGSYFRVSYRPFIRWLIDVELDEYDDYIFDILLQGDLGDFPGNQSEIDIAVVLSETPNFAQHNSKILIREVLSSPSFYYYRTYDPTQHSDNFVVPGQKYYLGLYVNGQLASFQQTPAFAEPANAIDVKFESQQFCWLY
ncbi:MAG: hypothetical protein LRY41_01395, partial [Candidatus Pacebacteria bacterium]|nr:hypothetical protein [Candidatus Paceibacterota bacterium]